MFVLPKLKNPYSAYGPYIDAQTMEIHHTKHHGGYVKKLNQAMVDNNLTTERIEDLFDTISKFPIEIRNNAGGHYNHTVFWNVLDDTMTTPSTELFPLINETFGSIDNFKVEFTKAALEIFGSGWCWLVLNNGKLKITTTKNQDNPLMSDINSGYPLLGVDIWEHAYYLKYQNRRVDYLNNIWALIDWNHVSYRFSQQPEMNDLA
jgi:Fe-Mn family superoxide dismutase